MCVRPAVRLTARLTLCPHTVWCLQCGSVLGEGVFGLAVLSERRQM